MYTLNDNKTITFTCTCICSQAAPLRVCVCVRMCMCASTCVINRSHTHYCGECEIIVKTVSIPYTCTQQVLHTCIYTHNNIIIHLHVHFNTLTHTQYIHVSIGMLINPVYLRYPTNIKGYQVHASAVEARYSMWGCVVYHIHVQTHTKLTLTLRE